jgi:hypothetical protein
MLVMLEKPETGEHKALGVGWNWSFLLFSSFLGLPLFRKGLPVWGALILILWGLDWALPLITPDATVTAILVPGAAIAGLSVFLGYRGNAMIARRYLARGYQFARPQSVEARLAAQRWGLTG